MDGNPNRRLTVLIVEDEPDLREAIAEVIEQAGYHFVSVADLAQARAALASTEIDLILLDVLVEGESSEALLHELSMQTSPPVTVITTADATQRSRTIASRYAVPLVLKPFDLDELVETVGRAHREHRVPRVAN